MKFVYGCLALFAFLIYSMLFGESEVSDVELARFALDELPVLVEENAQVLAEYDPQVSSDGGGALRIEAEGPTLIDLATVEGAGENRSFRQLLYQAKLRTEDVTGPVFLVMQAGIAEVPMPVIGIDTALTGTNDWTPIETYAGNPQDTYHKATTTLQLEIRGSGTVWVDDLRLVSRRHL